LRRRRRVDVSSHAAGAHAHAAAEGRCFQAITADWIGRVADVATRRAIAEAFANIGEDCR
jgi:hypothetical protein